MTDDTAFFTTHKWLIPTAAITGLLLVILLALGVLGGDSKIAPGSQALKTEPLPNEADIFTVNRQMTANALTWQGTVRSRWAVKITPKLTARIIDIPVHPGDRLKKGALIARLDDRDVLASSHASHAAELAAQAQAAQATAEEKRMTTLFNKQAATRQQYEAALAQAQAARALAQQAVSATQQTQVVLGENVLTAPFDGIIGERLQEPGDLGVPNQAIVTFHKPDDLRLDVPIASHCANQAKIGMTLNVRIDAIAQTLTGIVDEIAPEIDPQTRSQTIKVRLPATNSVQPGQLGWLELACQPEQQTLLIPTTALVHYGQLQAVNIIDQQHLQIRHIRTGKAYGDQVEVLSGLHEGERILRNSEVKP